MNGVANDPKVAEALGELQQYLSDAISPLVVADSIALLLGVPPEIVADEIRSWTTSQHRRLGANVPISDYLYHAIRKLYVMGEFTLVSKEAMAAYLEVLEGYLLVLCPAEDRDLLRENLAHLGDVRSDLAAPVATLHRAIEEEAPRRRGRGDGEDGRPRHPPVRPTGRAHGAAPDPRRAGRARLGRARRRLLAARVPGGSDLRHERGIRAGQGEPAGVRHGLVDGERLPFARPPAPGVGRAGGAAGVEGPGAALTATAHAMERIVALEHDPREAARRFQELVQAAIEQCNEGSLARAVTMLDLAGLLLAEKKVDPAYVRGFREQAHGRLDEQRLRRYAEDAASHSLLSHVLGFFPALEPAGLLDALKVEEKRDRRHLLLALLEVHGAAARAQAFERLSASVASFGDKDAHYQRNLLYLLRRIPRPDGPVPPPEIQTAIGFSAVGRPVIVLKEAVAYLGQVKDERAEHALIARVGDYETRAPQARNRRVRPRGAAVGARPGGVRARAPRHPGRDPGGRQPRAEEEPSAGGHDRSPDRALRHEPRGSP